MQISFEDAVVKLAEEAGATYLLVNIPGVWEVVSEHFNNDALKMMEETRPTIECSQCAELLEADDEDITEVVGPKYGDPPLCDACRECLCEFCDKFHDWTVGECGECGATICEDCHHKNLCCDGPRSSSKVKELLKDIHKGFDALEKALDSEEGEAMMEDTCKHPNATSTWSAVHQSMEHFHCPDCDKRWSD